MKLQQNRLIGATLFIAINGFLASGFLASPAFADFVQCNGVWTNQPCEGKVNATISQNTAAAVSDDPGKGEKRSLLHEITMKSIKAREEFEIRFDLKSLEDFCLKKETSAEDCQKKIAQADSELDKKILRESRIASERKQRKADDEKEKIAKTQNEANATQVNIIQNRPYQYPYQYPQGYPDYPNYPNPYNNVYQPITNQGTVPQGGAGVINQHGYYVPRADTNKPIGSGSSDRTGFPNSNDDSGRGRR